MVCAFGRKTIDTIKGAMCLRLRSALLLGMTTRKVPNRRLFYVAQPGLEPRQTEPESVVLPLHH